MRGSSLPVVFVCVFLAVASLAFGQVGNGTITGTITDPTGAVVPGAKVDARNTQTGVHFDTASTVTGTYTITDLPVGSYTVTVTVTGFKTYNHSNLGVPATQTVREDIALQVGASSESV